MFSNWSDLASKLDDALEKCRLQVQVRSGAVIDAMILLLQWDWKYAASALDTNNGSTAAVPNMVDLVAFELQVRFKLRITVEQIYPRDKIVAGCGFENQNFLSRRRRLPGRRSCIVGHLHSVFGTTFKRNRCFVTLI
jgi:hypothetical protein